MRFLSPPPETGIDPSGPAGGFSAPQKRGEWVMDDLIFIIVGAACFVGLGLYGRLLRSL
jgi:hypothetical protein